MRHAMTKTAMLALLVAALATPGATGQSRYTENTLQLDEGAERPRAKLDQLAFMVGAWEGEAFGGRFEEVWSAPSVGTMTGTFKLIHDEKPSMYEFEIIVEDEGSLAIRLKHFNADLSAWEEKAEFVEFPLVKLNEEGAFFAGLTYRRIGPDELGVFLAMKTKVGVREERLTYRRMR